MRLLVKIMTKDEISLALAMKWLPYFILCPVTTFCYEIFEKNLNQLTELIIDKYFRIFRCLTSITDDDYFSPILRTNNLVLNLNLKGNERDNEIILKSYEEGCGGYVVRVHPSNRYKVIQTMQKSYRKSSTYRYNIQRYLFLPIDENDTDIEILQRLHMFFMPNFLMVTSNSSDYSIWSHTTFNGHKFEVLGIKYELMDVWNSDVGFKYNVNLYHDRIKNLNGKKIKLGLIQYSPYTFVIKEGNNTIYDGLETRIATEFVRLNNGTWDGIDHPIHLWGELFDNGSGNGILGSVINHKADMGMAAIYQWYCDIMGCSYPYILAGVTCMVPRPQLVSGWLTIVLPFTVRTWIALISVYLISSSFVFFMSTVLKHMKDQKIDSHGLLLFEAFFNTFRLQLEQIPKVAYTKTPLALYLKWLTVYYFFVAVCWSGGIASILTIPRYEPPINAPIDLVSRYPKMKWGANHIDWTLSIRQSTNPITAQIVRDFVVLDEKTLRRKTKTRDFAFFMERLPMGHYGMSEYLDEESLKYLKIMEHNIYTASCVIILPKGSPYQQLLDKIIIRMMDAGLIQKLETQVAIERVNNRFHNMITRSNDKPTEEATSLQVRHIEGAIVMYSGGIVLSIITFFAELCSHRIFTKYKQEIVKRITVKPRTIVRPLLFVDDYND